MKEKRNLIIGLLLGSLFGWTLGFLRLPLVEKNFSFLMGFISCLAFISICLLLIFIWNKNVLLLRLIGKAPHVEDAKNTMRTYTLLWVVTAIFIGIGGSISAYLILKQSQYYKSQIQYQNKQIAQQSALMEATRNSNLTVLMDNLFDQIDEELKEHPQRRLSEKTIERIAALNYSFQPYRYLKGDSLSEKKLSPERGQLLVLLASLNMDSSSFNAIKRQNSFLGADLEGADLSEIDLSGIDLREAHLKDAVLTRANLNRADLKKANLWGSHLKEASMVEADLQNANLSWANLMDAELRGAMLNGVKMTSAKLANADLRKASVMYANLSDTFLNEADLTEVDISFTGLKNANLSHANLQNAIMKTTDLSYAILDHTNMEGVNLRWAVIGEKNWFEKLEKWQVKGAKTIQQGYDLIPDTGGLGHYRLPPKE